MTERARRLLLAFALVIGGAGQLHPEEPRALAIGMIGLDPDPRYVEGSAFAGIVFRTLGPAAPGAAAGIEDAAAIGRLVGISPSLIEARAHGPDQIIPLVTGWCSGAASASCWLICRRSS
jgi:hypothetical protein